MVDLDSRRLARLTAAANSHREVSSDARATRDAAWYDAWAGGATVREIAAASGAAPATVHRGILRELAQRGEDPT